MKKNMKNLKFKCPYCGHEDNHLIVEEDLTELKRAFPFIVVGEELTDENIGLNYKFLEVVDNLGTRYYCPHCDKKIDEQYGLKDLIIN